MNTATIERTIDVPESREVQFTLPESVPSGQVHITIAWDPAAREQPLDPCFEGGVNPSLRGTIKVLGDIIGPFHEEWEGALDEGEGIY